MLRSIVEEYARMGWAEEQLMPLFTDPVYRTCALGRRFGEARVREVVRETLARCGVARVQVTTRPEDAR